MCFNFTTHSIKVTGPLWQIRWSTEKAKQRKQPPKLQHQNESPTSMAPYKSTTKINQSGTTLKYFDPLRTHKYHILILTPCLMMGEVSLETSATKHYDSRYDELRKQYRCRHWTSFLKKFLFPISTERSPF